MPHTDPLKRSAARLRSWCIEKALPIWAERAHLSDGSWVEHLKLDGQPDLTAERRWRVLARQVYVYAKATSLGWYDGLEIAEITYQKMQAVGPVHRVTMAGDITNDMRDLYDHAFYVLAASSLYNLKKRESYLRDAETLLDWIDETLAHPAGGWMETNQASHSDARRQNPHMHLLEASLFLHGVTGATRHVEFAQRVFTIFEKYVFDTGTISEFFESDWTLAVGDEGQTAEPGHGMEWVWLLGQYEKATGENVDTYQAELYKRALQGRGWFLNDEESKSGDVRRETKRLWVQTEVIKAHLAMAENGTSGARDMAAATIDALFPTYLTDTGLWNDQINACGSNIATTIPVSTFYHILCMASEAERLAAQPRYG
ncbi:MAG: AGE family epimerase/isomerase [Litorimonas sp.]